MYLLDSVLSRKSAVDNHTLNDDVFMRNKINDAVKSKVQELSFEKNVSYSHPDIRYMSSNMYLHYLLPKLPQNSKQVQEVLTKIELF